MGAVRGGNAQQLAILFERYHLALFRFYYRLSGDRQSSEDLVQEVFWRILKYRETYQPGAPFTTWMYRIARNAQTDHWRKKKPEVGFADNWDAPAEPGVTLEEKEQHELVRRALAMLPAEKREVLVLSRYQGMKYEQIADLLGCEVGTIKVRVFRAVRELKDIFLQLQGARAT